MTFELLQARAADDPHDDLYPSPAESKNSVVLEPDDGQVRVADVDAVRAEAILNDQRTPLGEATDIKGALLLTDSRLVFACTDFRRGGGWRGYGTAGLLTAAAANAISHAVARHGTRGYSLVGHVRHDWMAGAFVVAQTYRRRHSPNVLKVVLHDPTDYPRVLSLALYLDNHVPTADFGKDVTARIARALAASAEADKRTVFSDFAAAPISKPLTSGNGVSWQLPS